MKSSRIDRILMDQGTLLDTDDQDLLINEFAAINSSTHQFNVVVVNGFTISLMAVLTILKLWLRLGISHFTVVLILLLNYIKFKYFGASKRFSYAVAAVNCMGFFMVGIDWVFLVPIIDLGLYYYVYNEFEGTARDINGLMGRRYKYKDV